MADGGLCPVPRYAYGLGTEAAELIEQVTSGHLVELPPDARKTLQFCKKMNAANIAAE
ncbi:MAG: hypothetical protein AAGA35_02605 [Patescibacteria group bacterium]